MWNTPTKKDLDVIPGIFQTERTSLRDKVIYQHFFIGSCDWYIAEYDEEDDLFWGFANLGDDVNAEWGYIPFEDIRQLKVGPLGFEIDCECGWVPQKACEIENIKQAQCW